MRLTTSGRDMAGLVRGGLGGFSVKRGFILPILPEPGVDTEEDLVIAAQLLQAKLNGNT